MIYDSTFNASESCRIELKLQICKHINGNALLLAMSNLQNVSKFK